MDIIDKLREIVGERVSAAPSERLCYSSDASQVRGTPDFVVRPLTTEEVSRVVALAASEGAPVTARGAGTGLAGGAVPLRGGIVLDLSGMNRIVEMDLSNLAVVVEPGGRPGRLNQALKPSGFFPPRPRKLSILHHRRPHRQQRFRNALRQVDDPSTSWTWRWCWPTAPSSEPARTLKSAAGYDLTRLFIGSEGTLGIITKAVLQVAPAEVRRLVIASFDDAEAAGER